jgi:hypothetical protein
MAQGYEDLIMAEQPFKTFIVETEDGTRIEMPFVGSPLQLALTDEKVLNGLKGKVIKKIVCVPGRIINFVVE